MTIEQDRDQNLYQIFRTFCPTILKSNE